MCETEYMRFDLEYDLVIVISSKTAHASTKDVLNDHAIPAIASMDILQTIDRQKWPLKDEHELPTDE